jgi:hypothetical protein
MVTMRYTICLLFFTATLFGQVAPMQPLSTYGRNFWNHFYISGDYAVTVMSYDKGLSVLDIRDPQNVELVNSFPLKGFIYNTEIEGDRMVANPNGQLAIIDLSDLPEISLLNTPTIRACEVQIEDHVVMSYCSWEDELKLLDISDPTSPQLMGTTVIESIKRIVYNDTFLYALHEDEPTVMVFDASEPSAIQQVHSISLEGDLRQLDLAGDSLFVTNAASDGPAIFTLDITTPGHLTLCSSSEMSSSVKDIAISDGIFYGLMDDQLQISKLDGACQLAGSGSVTTLGTQGARNIQVHGDRAVIQTGANFEIYDIASEPFLIGSYEEVLNIGDFEIMGDIAVISGSHGVSTMDISDRSNPIVLDKLPVDWLSHLHVAHGYAYVRDPSRPGGFYVLDISSPENIVEVTKVPIGRTTDLEGNDDFLFVMDFFELNVYSLSDPAQPRLLKTYGNDIASHVFAVSDGLYVYQAGRDFTIAEIAADGTLTTLSEIEFPQNGREKITVEGDFLYIANDETGMYIYDISEPTNPKFMSTTPIATDDAYLVSANNGIIGYVGIESYFVIDARNPENPVIVAEKLDAGPLFPAPLFVDGPYVYSDQDGFTIEGIGCVDRETSAERFQSWHSNQEITVLDLIYSVPCE